VSFDRGGLDLYVMSLGLMLYWSGSVFVLVVFCDSSLQVAISVTFVSRVHLSGSGHDKGQDAKRK
jgi:hypothetical protein